MNQYKIWKPKDLLFYSEIPLKIVNAKNVEGGIEVKFEFGDFSTIRFYDSDFSKKEFENQIELDKINWLKDIARSIILKEEKVAGFVHLHDLLKEGLV